MEEITIIAGITIAAYVLKGRLYYILSSLTLFFYGLAYIDTSVYLAISIIIFALLTGARVIFQGKKE